MLDLSQPVADPRLKLTSVNLSFWQTNIIRSGLPYEICVQMRDAVLEAMGKALASGVVEYHVGSRGLRRFTLKELQDLLTFWQNAANDAAQGPMSAIQSRRAVPCDV